MRILLDIGHPAHVHFYKHAIRCLQDDGHEVVIGARHKDVTLALLRHYDLPYRLLSTIQEGVTGKAREFCQHERALLHLMTEFHPHVVSEVGGLFVAAIARAFQVPTVVFTDTEGVRLNHYLTYPFATLICTPSWFKDDLGTRHVRYAGCHELAYLHPDYFRPDPGVLHELGLAPGEPFTVLRFVSWQATHDLGHEGLSLSFKRKLVNTLTEYGRVFITSEAQLAAEFEPHQIQLPPHRIHHILAFARLYIGEGATMATEAALLGTPSIYVSPLATRLGYIDQLDSNYRLIDSYPSGPAALCRAVSILQDEDDTTSRLARRDRLISDTIDVTRFVTNTIRQATR